MLGAAFSGHLLRSNVLFLLSGRFLCAPMQKKKKFFLRKGNGRTPGAGAGAPPLTDADKSRLDNWRIRRVPLRQFQVRSVVTGSRPIYVFVPNSQPTSRRLDSCRMRNPAVRKLSAHS